MFRDAKEELKRLEAQLLAEEEETLPEEEFSTEDEIPEEINDEQLRKLLSIVDSLDVEEERAEEVILDSEEETEEDITDFEMETAQPHNVATKYRAYNSDTSDEDLNTYSENVRNAESYKKSTGLMKVLVLILVLLIASMGGLAWWMLKLYGVI